MICNKKTRILLVDDSDTMRKLIRRILRQLDFEYIVEAADGVEAWEVLQRTHVDFIVSDWNMPRMTGIDFLRKVRESEKFGHLPFLMVTAEAQKTNVIEAIEARVSNYIVKPFNAHTLQAKIEAIFKCEASAAERHAAGDCPDGEMEDVGEFGDTVVPDVPEEVVHASAGPEKRDPAAPPTIQRVHFPRI